MNKHVEEYTVRDLGDGAETILYGFSMPLDSDGDTGMVFVDATPIDDDRRGKLVDLIAMAPDMLQCLEQLCHGDTVDRHDYEEAEAVIREARGEA